MPAHAHPEVHTLQDLHTHLDKIVGHSGPRGGFYAADRRSPNQAPTFAQWALHHGLKIDSLGSSQKESWQKVQFAARTPINHSRNLGFAHEYFGVLF